MQSIPLHQFDNYQDRFILTARHCVSWDHNGVVVDGRRVQVRKNTFKEHMLVWCSSFLSRSGSAVTGARARTGSVSALRGSSSGQTTSSRSVPGEGSAPHVIRLSVSLCCSGLWCPDWAPWGHTTLTNDIALLELLTPAPASARVRPIALSRAPLPPGTTAWVGGWGLDGFQPTRTLNLGK